MPVQDPKSKVFFTAARGKPQSCAAGRVLQSRNGDLPAQRGGALLDQRGAEYSYPLNLHRDALNRVSAIDLNEHTRLFGEREPEQFPPLHDCSQAERVA